MTLSDARQCARAVLSGHFEASLVLVSSAVRVQLVDASRLTRSPFTRHGDNIDCPRWTLNDVSVAAVAEAGEVVTVRVRPLSILPSLAPSCQPEDDMFARMHNSASSLYLWYTLRVYVTLASFFA